MFLVKADFKDLIKQLDDVQKRQIPFATSLAINRTAQKVKDAQQKEMRDVFDRPTQFTINSLFIKPSTKQTLTARVGFKDYALKGTAAAKYLQAEISGGERRLKRYEVALRSAGVLPEGYFTVPGDAASIDAYGNIARSQIVQIISYFRANRESGSSSNSTDKTRAKLAKSTKSRYGISYFVGAPAGGKLPLGIWMKVNTNFGTSNPRPVLIFIKSTNYEPIYDFKYVAENTVKKYIDDEFSKAMKEAVATAKW